jgi:hypothetical protein
MTQTGSDIAGLLRTDFGEEAEAGFPHLSRVPQTRVVQFLDYFASLCRNDQAELLDALALRGSVLCNLSLGASFPVVPAFDRYWNTVSAPGPFTGGFRYCDVKFLALVPKIPEFGSHEDWIEKSQKPWVSELALTPRDDLLPEMSCLKPASTRLLRKLVKDTLGDRGFSPEVVRGAEHKYVRASGDKVRIDFGSYMGQLCYGVSAVRDSSRIVGLSYEALWGQAGGWDYLTEENATRAIGHLPELVEYLIRLTERIARLV